MNVKIIRYVTAIWLLLSIGIVSANAQVKNDDTDILQDTLSVSVVVADRLMRDNITQTGLQRLDSKKLKLSGALFSSPDLIKAIQMLPGVSGGSELSSGLYVHGGTGSDNLFLLDGVPLYQVSHLAGLFSSFNTDVIENADFYSSGFPARYGGRLSSVVDVQTRPGDFKEYHGIFSIGLIDGRLQFEGPIVKNKTSINVALRRSWLDILTIPALAIINHRKRDSGLKSDFRYAFWDLNAGVTHRFSNDNMLSLNFYGGSDLFNVKFKNNENRENPDSASYILGNTARWGNFLTSLKWNYAISDNLKFRLIGYHTIFNGKIDIDIESDDLKNQSFVTSTNISRINDLGLVADFWWAPAKRHLVRFGAGWQSHFYNAERETKIKTIGASIDSTADKNGGKYYGSEPYVYIEDEMNLASWYKLNLGLRYALYACKGKVYHAVEPRVAMNFKVSEKVSIKTSYTKMTQFNHQVASLYLDLPTNLWMPSTATVKPMESWQVALSTEYKFNPEMHITLEGYWKAMDKLHEYVGKAAFFPPIDEWETSFSEGKGRSYGGDVEFGYRTDKIDVYCAYTLSWTERYFERICADWYPDRFDNRHKFTISGSYDFNDFFSIYAAWNFHSGNRMTISDYVVPADRTDGLKDTEMGDLTSILSSSSVEIQTSPNNIALPPYHRLDLGLTFNKTTRRGNLSTWNVSIYNAYCRMNPYYGMVRTDNKLKKIVSSYYGIIPIIPSFSYCLKF